MKNQRKIKLIFGLGNPDEKYKDTPHNFGRDLLKEYIKAPKELKYSIFDKYDDIVLGIGKVFVNQSGKALSELQKKFKLKPEEILVIHDEADLPFMWLKLSFKKSSAGHKGIESIYKALKTWNFWRLRVGIQGKKRKKAMDIILKKLTPKKKKVWDNAKKKFKEILEKIKTTPPEKLSIPQKFFLDE